jgi:hypothetical protein
MRAILFLMHRFSPNNHSSQIVEELEDRLGERMDDVLTHVRSSLSAPAAATIATQTASATDTALIYVDDQWETYVDADVDAEAAVNETVFDDMGEGMGVEGDLDMDDD